MPNDQPQRDKTTPRIPWWLPALVMALAVATFIIPAWVNYVIAHRWMEMANHG